MQAVNKERVAGLLQGLAQFGKTEHGRGQGSAGLAAAAGAGFKAAAVN